MNYIADHIGRAMALTHNAMLLTEAAAYGSKLIDFASASEIADGEPEGLAYDDSLAYYLDDGGSISWVMRPTPRGNQENFGRFPALCRDAGRQWPESFELPGQLLKSRGSGHRQHEECLFRKLVLYGDA